MRDCRQFYIDGQWGDPAKAHDFTVTTEEAIATISLGSRADVDRAVAAAKHAFESSETTPEDRLALLRRVLGVYQSKMDQMAETISLEMGVPISLSRKAQAPAGLGHLAEIVKVLEYFQFEAPLSAYLFAEILHDAAVPPGVFNLVNGDGPTVGAPMASHLGSGAM